MLRAAVAAGSELGTEAKGYMDAGLLVPDGIIIGLIVERLQHDDASSGVLLDGYPRTIPQAEALSEVAVVSTVISIEVSDDAIVERIVGRRMDPETGGIYHVSFNPPPPEVSGRLIQREDDNEQTVRNRLSAYHAGLASAGAVDAVAEVLLLGRPFGVVMRGVKGIRDPALVWLRNTAMMWLQRYVVSEVGCAQIQSAAWRFHVDIGAP